MKNRLIQVFLLAVISGSLLCTSVQSAEGETSILFIFDASGSMNQKVEGKSKLNISKDILSDLIGDMPSETQVGFMVYGHAGAVKKGCDAIELSVPIKALDSDLIKKKIMALQAKGKTPIAASLEQGAEVIEKIKGAKMIVLISDGEETCGGNPLKEAEKLKKAHRDDILIYVIGFAVKGKERKQLEGIAKAGGGSYFSADTAEQLKKSLAVIKEEVITIKKKKQLKTGGDIYFDQFEEPFLSEKWDVVNEDPDSMFIDEGFLIAINMIGSAQTKEGTNITNMLLFKDKLPKNYEVVTGFTTEATNFTHNNFRNNQWSGIVFYKDKKNIMGFAVQGAFGTYGQLTFNNEAIMFKYQGGKYIKPLTKTIYKTPRKKPNGEKDFYLKVRKKKFKYTSFFSTDGKKWTEVGSVTILGKGFRPGIAAWRNKSAVETVTNFDYFKVKELK